MGMGNPLSKYILVYIHTGMEAVSARLHTCIQCSFHSTCIEFFEFFQTLSNASAAAQVNVIQTMY